MGENGRVFCMLLDVLDGVDNNTSLVTTEERRLLDGMKERRELSGFTLSESRLISDVHDRMAEEGPITDTGPLSD